MDKSALIAVIVLWNRTDGSMERLTNFRVSVLDQDENQKWEGVWHADLWQQGMGEGSVGFYALVTALLLGLTFGVGSLFLPKPGRGTAA